MTKRERQAELDLEVAQASLEREKQVELERHRDHQLQMKLAASAYDAAIKDQERFRELFRAGIISRRQLEEAEKREREARLQHENAGMRARDDGTAVELAQARVRAAEQSLQVLIAKGESEKQDLEAELAAGNARLRQMKLDLDRLRYDLQLCQVLSPVAGTITHAELQSSSVVAAGDLAATIAPAGILKFEGLVPNSEIAEIRVGQEVRIKLDAFPFQEHGTVPGEIAFVAPDAVNSGESGRTGYEIHVRLIGDHFGTDPLNPIELELGMAGTAEIVRERRTLLYLVAQSIFRQQNSESHG
jgi:HlyD family secretion protein